MSEIPRPRDGGQGDRQAHRREQADGNRLEAPLRQRSRRRSGESGRSRAVPAGSTTLPWSCAQDQALDRTAPSLPLRPGPAERRSHDYVRQAGRTVRGIGGGRPAYVTGRRRDQPRPATYSASTSPARTTATCSPSGPNRRSGWWPNSAPPATLSAATRRPPRCCGACSPPPRLRPQDAHHPEKGVIAFDHASFRPTMFTRDFAVPWTNNVSERGARPPSGNRPCRATGAPSPPSPAGAGSAATSTPPPPMATPASRPSTLPSREGPGHRPCQRSPNAHSHATREWTPVAPQWRRDGRLLRGQPGLWVIAAIGASGVPVRGSSPHGEIGQSSTCRHTRPHNARPPLQRGKFFTFCFLMLLFSGASWCERRPLWGSRAPGAVTA